MELGNFVLGEEPLSTWGSGDRAARVLLAQVDGHSPSTWRVASGSGSGSGWSVHSQDWGRKYLASNGGCVYIDLAHLELCIPEVRSAWDALAAHHAMLLIARQALVDANVRIPDGRRIQVLANNSDGRGNSYGSHLNVLVSRQCWENLFRRKLHHLLVLAAYQVSSIVFTGQGKVGAENDRAPVDYQLSQRADFFEELVAAHTTYSRPIVNSRDEPLCGNGVPELARLHCIFYDNTLCHSATLLKVGVLQIVLAMIEADCADVALALDDPVAAVVSWSHDPTLRARCRLAGGEAVTAVELQLRFLEAAKRFAAEGGLATVPRADEILALWEDTLRKLEAGDLLALVGRLDWVLKLQLLELALEKRPELDWSSPEIRHLDLLYSSLDPEEGLYWLYEARGIAERLVSDEEIARFLEAPPDDTRAYTRAMLLRRLEPDQLDSIDWHRLRLHVPAPGGFSRVAELDLDDPRAFTKSDTESLFRRAGSLEQLVDSLGAARDDDAPALVSAVPARTH